MLLTALNAPLQKRYASEFSHTIMHSNPAKNHLAFTNLNLPGSDKHSDSKSKQQHAGVGTVAPFVCF